MAPNKTWKKVLLYLVLPPVLVIALLRLFLFYLIPPLLEVKFDRNRGTQIAQAIQAGHLSPDERGQVKLPPHLRYGFQDENIYVTRRSDIVLIYFPTLNFRTQHRGYLYVSRPLKQSDKDPRFYGGECVLIGLWGNPPGPVPLSQNINPHWFYVVQRFQQQ